jgi:hypothetical protein
MVIPGSIVRQVAAFAFPATLVVCVGACTTRPSWQTPVKDVYVTPTDARTASLHAARVIELPERLANRTMQLGAVAAIAYDAPGVDARPVAVLRQDSAVRVIAECHFVRIPRSADMREYIGATGGDITPSWVKVAAGGREGWVPARCLVHPSDLAVSRAMGPGPQSPAAAGRIDELVVATAAHPRNPGASRDPFGATVEASDLPQMGEPLEALDSRADAAAQAAVAKANEPGDLSKGVDMAESGLGLLGQLGVKQADDPKVKDAAAVAKGAAQILDIVSRRRSLTQVDERLLGRACFTRVLGNVTPLAGDDAIVRYVNWIGDRVAAHSTNPFPAIALEFVVIPDYPANAIAIPGGPIVVSMGMLRELRSEDELAAVLGHAIAHVEERHGLGRAKSRGLESLRDPEQLAEPISASSQQAAANAARQMALSPEATAAVEREMQKEQVKLSKAMSSMLGSGGLDRIAQDVTDFAVHGDPACEPSADLRGMSLAAAAGYQPAALAAVIERFHAGHAAWEGIAGDARSRASMCREIADDLVMRTAPPPQASPASPHGTPTLPDEPQDRWKRLQDELAQRGW